MANLHYVGSLEKRMQAADQDAFRLMIIDAVNQGNWSLSIKLRFECFVIVE